jgi:hypothetical protein
MFIDNGIEEGGFDVEVEVKAEGGRRKSGLTRNHEEKRELEE